MMNESYEIKNATNFVAGTVGVPGDRIFFLQAQSEEFILTLKVEKGQVQSLASLLAEILEDQAEAFEVPKVSEMIEPPNAAWTVGALAIGLNDLSPEVVVVAQELPDEDDAEPAEAHIHINFGQAKAFVDHALFLVEYGRDFGRQNGHKPIGE